MEAKILIVEDEEKLARFVELELKHEGYVVEKASNGRDALDMALANDYTLILLDIMLPGLNGLEVLRRLNKEKPTPVILLTARDAVMDKVAGLDAGAVERQLINILDLAALGLKKRGLDEEVLLNPLYERAEKHTNPAKTMLDGISKGLPITNYIEQYAAI